MTLEQRSDWPTLIATLNAHYHVEFEARAAEEELITRKQGNKESVRDFISNLQALARRAFGKDLAKREAAVLKRLKLGLNTPSLRRTYDDVMLHPGATLTIVTSELVRRERQDDPSRCQAKIIQEKVQDIAKKPQHTSVEDPVHKVLAAQAATKDKKPTGDDAAKSNPTSRRARGGGTKTGSVESRKEAKDYSTLQCWNCEKTGHPRTRCPAASEDKAKWLEIARLNFKKRAGASEASDAKSSASSGKQQEN